MPVLAPRTYLPGELIYSETPFVHVLPLSLKDQACESCRCRFFTLRFCKQCLAVKYCGKACQKRDWKNHRLECKHMENLPDRDTADFVRLIARVILKIKDKDWKSFKTSVLGTEVSFDEIDSHYKEMTENPHLNLMYKEIKEDLTRFIGSENMPSDVNTVKIIGKVIINSYLSRDNTLPALCFFMGMSVFDLECVANCSYFITKGNLKVWASRKIQKGSEKITISNRRFLGGDFNQLCNFNRIAKQGCRCSDCSLPYGESVLSKILDEKKAFSVITGTETVLKLSDILSTVNVEDELKDVVDEILKKHVGVLGRTNILHLRLLGFRYLQIGGRAFEIKEGLLELESNMRSVFGEYYSEMFPVYKALGLVYLQLGNPVLAAMYFQKARKLDDLKS